MKKLQPVITYYNKTAEYEEKRLKQDLYHYVEFHTIMHFLKKHLPKKGLVLDVGCGAGAYAIPLARKGYKMVMLDISPALVRRARENVKREGVEKNVVEVNEGNVLDLSRYPENHFDSVLCLGPMYHLVRRKDQLKALQEMKRVAKPGAPIFVACINYYGVIARILTDKRFWYEFTDKNHRRMFKEGVHLKKWHAEAQETFPDAKFHKPEEMLELTREAGLETITMFACEGLGGCLRKEVNALGTESPDLYKKWLEIITKTAESPYGFGATEHFVWVGRKTS